MSRNISVDSFDCQELRAKILIVEDSKFFNNILKKNLSKHTISQAFTLAEALKLIEKEDFDFILLDLILPDGDGEDIIELMPKKVRSKVIVLSSSEDIERREYLFEAGVLDYISKMNPFGLIIKDIEDIFCSVARNPYINILLVDDSRFVLNVVSKLLRAKKFNVYEAMDAKSGLEILATKEIHLLLLDYEMPQMNGAQMLEEIRKEDAFLDLPVIMLSGTDKKDVVARVLKHGANDYIKKPFENEELLLKCNLQIKQYFNMRQLKKKEQKIEMLLKKLNERYKYELSQQKIAKEKLESVISNEYPQQSFVLYIPYDTLSGDHYSLLSFKNGVKLFYIIDGQGHGISPALTVFAISSMVKNVLHYVTDLQSFVGELFGLIKTFLGEEEQLSYTFIALNEEDETLEYVSAGMYPFYVKDASGISKHKANNIPFMNFSEIPTVKDIPIKEFEALVLYSDGLIEHCQDRLCKERVPQTLQETKVLYSLEDELASVELEDDVTLIFYSKHALKKEE
jgi:DNA-binding response OmpR family regulator